MKLFNMLKWVLRVQGFVGDMEEENNYSDPPQGAYYFVFALTMILLGVAMFQYPLW